MIVICTGFKWYMPINEWMIIDYRSFGFEVRVFKIIVSFKILFSLQFDLFSKYMFSWRKDWKTWRLPRIIFKQISEC